MKFITGLIILVILGTVLLFIFFSPTIFQEGNPIPVAIGIAKITTTGNTYAKIDEHKYIVKANTQDIKKLTDYLAQHDLVYSDQEGSAYFFKSKNGKTYIAMAKMFSSSFEIF